jgi:hypothetical protein
VIPRGTPGWAWWRLEAHALPKFIADLEHLEKRGLSDDVCRLVTSTLRNLVETVENAERSFWKPHLLSDLRDFHAIYVKWNQRDQGTDLVDRAHRREAIAALREVRARIGKRVLKGPYVLSNEHDLEIATLCYRHFQALVSSQAELFPQLRGDVGNFATSVTL